MKVNLGAGDAPREGWRNFDFDDFDVTQPWPLETCSISRLNADCLLPHIPPPAPGERDGFDVLMLEAARCMRYGATFTFTAPDWRRPDEALTDVCHYRLIGPRSFYHYHAEERKRPLGAGGLWFLQPSWRPAAVTSETLGDARPRRLRRLAVAMGRLDWLRTTQLQWTMRRNLRRWSS